MNALSIRLYRTRGLDIRNDSRLVWCYMIDMLDKDWTIERVMDELALTHYLHNYTDYPLCFPELVALRHTLEQEYFQTTGEYRDFGEFIRRYYVPLYRMNAMLRKHPDGRFPRVWPWQQEEGVALP